LASRKGGREPIVALIIAEPAASLETVFGDLLPRLTFSGLIGVAAALVRGVIEEANYANLSHPEIGRLAELIVLERDDGFTSAFPARQGAEVRVRLADGTVVVRRIDDVIAATEAEIRARFLTAAAEVVGASRAAQIRDLVERCEKIADAATIVALCRTDSSREASREQRHVPGRLTA